jgi:hypothetical protein
MLVQDNTAFHLSTSYSTTAKNNKEKRKKNGLKKFEKDC